MLLPGGRGHLSRTRRLAFAALVLAVLLLHGLGLQSLALWQDLSLQAAPPRLQVALVRTMPLRRLAPPAPLRRPRAQALALPALRPGSELPRPASLPIQDDGGPSTDLPVGSAEAEPAEPGPEWPLSTRLVYRLSGHYQGPVHGDAEVEWLRQGRRYQVRLFVGVGPRLAPFIARRMLSQGELDAQGIRPQRYDEETRILLAAPRQLRLHLSPDGVDYPDGRRLPAPPGLQDSASQFVQLTWLLLTGRVQPREGLQLDLPLALPRRVHAWRYVMAAAETLDSPLGPLLAWPLHPAPELDSRGALRASVWLAPALDYLPLRIRIEQDAQSWVDLRLAEVPLQEAAPKPDNAASQTADSPP